MSDLSHDPRLPDLLRRLLAETEPNQRPAAHPDEGGGGSARPLPESPDVLKVLIDEARSFLNALEPVRKNFRLMLRLVERYKGAETMAQQDAGFLQELVACNRDKVLNLGPAIHGLMPYVEWDRESLQDFLATFGPQEDGSAGAPGDTDEARLRRKVDAVECFAGRIQALYQRLLDKLGSCSRTGAVAVARYPDEDRDSWIYERLCSGLAHKEVMTRLRDECGGQGWAPITSTQGIGKAAKKYARLHNLPPIRRRTAPRR
jgi:hypothetical protein